MRFSKQGHALVYEVNTENPEAPLKYTRLMEFPAHLAKFMIKYDDVSKNIMLPFKHASKLKYQTMMSRAMINALRDLNLDIDVVMPVPLAWRRLFKRGYNQATLLARPIAKHFNAR